MVFLHRYGWRSTIAMCLARRFMACLPKKCAPGPSGHQWRVSHSSRCPLLCGEIHLVHNVLPKADSALSMCPTYWQPSSKDPFAASYLRQQRAAIARAQVHLRVGCSARSLRDGEQRGSCTEPRSCCRLCRLAAGTCSAQHPWHGTCCCAQVVAAESPRGPTCYSSSFPWKAGDLLCLLSGLNFL